MRLHPNVCIFNSDGNALMTEGLIWAYLDDGWDGEVNTFADLPSFLVQIMERNILSKLLQEQLFWVRLLCRNIYF